MRTRSQAVHVPAVRRVPVELWHDILLRLGYRDLKVVQRVCKKWRAMIKTRTFDRALFRCKVDSKSPMTKQTVARVNPALQSIGLLSYKFPSVVIKGKAHLYRLKDSKSVCSEMVTLPASAKVEVEGFLDKTIYARQKGGVTVAALVKAVTRALSEPVDDSQVRSHFGGDREGEFYWYKEEGSYENTQWAWACHTGQESRTARYRGIKNVRCYDDGSVELSADVS